MNIWNNGPDSHLVPMGLSRPPGAVRGGVGGRVALCPPAPPAQLCGAPAEPGFLFQGR